MVILLLFTELKVKPMSTFSKRRLFLKLAGLSSLGLISYSYFRGIRMPPLMWEPSDISATTEYDGISIQGIDLIKTHRQVIKNVDVAFRAYTPNPSLTIDSIKKNTIRLSVNNIHSNAAFEYDPNSNVQISETVNGITRDIELNFTEPATIHLAWKLSDKTKYRFASIGDTGGSQELAWAIQRANDLGAEFLLHLGDFNYQDSDYASAITIFNKAPIPCYVSIGNHDFHDNGIQYQQFLNDIGPLNYQFSIGKTRFVNLDTAASTLPYSSGFRGKLMQKLIAEKNRYATTIAFTHRPLYDPEEGSDHDIGSLGERDWLVKSLKNANITTLLSGHIHIFHRRNFDGIDNIIVGQGLGHQDLITNSDYSKIAIGKVNISGDVEFEFMPLSMPLEMHCHPRTDVVKESLVNAKHADLIQSITSICNDA